MWGNSYLWQTDPLKIGTVGIPSIWEFLYTPTQGVSCLNTPGSWKGNGSGKGIDSKRVEDHLSFGAVNQGPCEDWPSFEEAIV